MKEFKICLIGCGQMTKDGHGLSCQKYAKEHDDVILAACCDINLEAAEFACKEYGFQKAYTDYLEMVDQEKPDVVLAVTPVELTKEISVALLERKIPVLLEKPPGMDPEENLAIHEAAIRNNIPARVAFNRRYTPLLCALMEEIKSANVPVIDVSCMFVRVGRKSTDFSTTAIHAIDTVRFLSGSDYAKVHLHYNDCLIEGIPVNNIQMTGIMQNGATVSATILPHGGCTVERLCVNLAGYTFFLYLPVWSGNDTPGKLVCMKDGAEYKTISGDDLISQYTLFESNGYYAECQIFFDQLRAGLRPESDVITGYSSVLIAQCIRERKSDIIIAE